MNGDGDTKQRVALLSEKGTEIPLHNLTLREELSTVCWCLKESFTVLSSLSFQLSNKTV